MPGVWFPLLDFIFTPKLFSNSLYHDLASSLPWARLLAKAFFYFVILTLSPRRKQMQKNRSVKNYQSFLTEPFCKFLHPNLWKVSPMSAHERFIKPLKSKTLSFASHHKYFCKCNPNSSTNIAYIHPIPKHPSISGVFPLSGHHLTC